jgi:hypothetical protein
VWTAIHLNIYPPSYPRWKRTLHKTGWAALALFAPEFVLWRAISQLETALKLCSQRNEIDKPYVPNRRRVESTPDENQSKPSSAVEASDVEASKSESWCLEHGFLVIMGGMTLSVEDANGTDVTWILKDRVTVTPLGAVELAKLGFVPPINKATIKARSKADQFAKALVCFQAGWMVLQTITRKAAHLPITLLELNTLAHVGCAVMMYAIWWKKPQNANEPIVVSVDVSTAVAMGLPDGFRMNSNSLLPGGFQISSEHLEDKEHRVILDGHPINVNPIQESENDTSAVNRLSREITRQSTSQVDPDIISPVNHPKVEEDWSRQLGESDLLPPNKTSLKVVGEVKGDRDGDWNDGTGYIRDGDWYDGTGYIQMKRMAKNERMETFKRIIEEVRKTDGVVMLLPGQRLEGWPFEKTTYPIHLTAKDVECLQIMATARPVDNRLFSKCLTERERNRSIQGNLESVSSMKTILLFAVLGMFYGSVHASSWNNHFPSVVEEFMWRISVCCIMGGGFIISALWYFFDRTGPEIPSVGRLLNIIWLVFGYSLFGVFSLLVIVYFVSRIYLVVEAFISVRSLPLGAYDTVSWVTFLPHIG